MPRVLDGRPCDGCRRDPPAFAACAVVGDYRCEPVLREWLLRLKHGGRPDLVHELGFALARSLEGLAAGDGRVHLGGGRSRGPRVVPVPLHPLRRLERGHDQALGLARVVAAELDLLLVRALARGRPTPPQGSPGAAARRENVRGAFRARRAARRVAGRDVLLVDDVLASGGTADAAARVLLAAGAARVVVAVVARA